MRYCEYAPDARLAGVVRCYWVFEADAVDEPVVERIVPDGCMELVFHFRDAFVDVCAAGAHPGRDLLQPRHLLAGQLTRPLLLRPGGQTGLVSVRFQPWGVQRLFRIPMSHLSDRVAEVSSLDARWLDRVDGEIDGCRDDRARIALIERAFLLRMASSDAPREDVLVSRCAALLTARKGIVSIDTMAGDLAIGKRQLERRFNDAIGLSPKAFASIVRFRALFDALEQDATGDWMSAALATGYFDQPHMIRDFRRYAGLSPTAFIESLPAFSRAMADV